MPEYRRYGNRDDVIAKDGDYGFVGFNNRLRPDQLTKGTLADAQNVRLDRNGEAQVRKGIELIVAPFAVGGDVLRLPTSEEIGLDVSRLPTTIRSASLTSNIASIVIDNPAVDPGYAFQAGDEVTVGGIEADVFDAGEADPNGTFVLLSVVDGGATKTLTYALTGDDVASYDVAVALPQVLSFNLSESEDNPVVGYNMLLDIGQVTEVYASTKFSDPNNNASESILIASNLSVVSKDLLNGTVNDIYYPLGETVPPFSDMLQAFNKVFIFRDGNTALEWDGIYTSIEASDLLLDRTYSITELGDTDWNSIAGTTGVTYNVNDPITVDVEGSGTGKARSAFTLVKSGRYSQPTQIICAPGEFAIVESRGIVHQPDGVSVGSTISVLGAYTTDENTTSGFKVGYEYTVAKIYKEGPSSSIGNQAGDQVIGDVELEGDYEGFRKVTLLLAGNDFDLGDPIQLAGFNTQAGINGPRFVSERTDNSFSFYTDEFSNNNTPLPGTVHLADGFEFWIQADSIDNHITDGASLNATPVFTRKVSTSLGFTHMPAPPYATYHQRRLVMPFRYSVDVTEGQYTYRGIIDEVIASDILDSDTYDEIYAQFRFNAGTSDYTVGLHSFSDDALLVFNRNSIHTVQNTVDLQGSVAKLLTNEVGCVARKSIIQVGNQVIFLSDNGVYGTQFLDEYNLRGTETPLSESINETIGRINRDHWEESCAVYFDNRYYIAVPLDDAQRNNAILIFNFINSQWESIDTVSDAEWDIENLIVAGAGVSRGVYAINRLGGIHKLDTRLDGRDRVVTSIGAPLRETYPIPASITTRQYTLGAIDRKNWKQFDMHVESSDSGTSNFDISAETENPDSDIPLQSLSDYITGDSLAAGEDVSIRGRLGNRRGYGIQYTINNTQGRPKIRAIETNGSISFRSTQSAE